MITAIWHMLSTGETYRELGGDYYQHHAPQHALKRKIRDLEAAGFHSHSSRASWLILTLRAGWFAAVGPFSNQSRGLLRDRESEPVSSFRLMDAEKASHSVARVADLLTVSRSGHYACKKREHAGRSPADQRQQQLTAIIIDFHDASDQAYGSPRILADLPDDGEQGSVKTVAKHMRSNGIVGISPRGWRPTTTVPDLGAGSIPDLGRGPPLRPARWTSLPTRRNCVGSRSLLYTSGTLRRTAVLRVGDEPPLQPRRRAEAALAQALSPIVPSNPEVHVEARTIRGGVREQSLAACSTAQLLVVARHRDHIWHPSGWVGSPDH